MKKMKFMTLGMCLAVIVSCGTATKNGALIGTGAGAALGAIIGKIAGNTAVGAVIGGAIGLYYHFKAVNAAKDIIEELKEE